MSDCLHCGKPVDTAQKNFRDSIYGAIEIYTVKGPSIVAAPFHAWCNAACLLAWIQEKLKEVDPC